MKQIAFLFCIYVLFQINSQAQTTTLIQGFKNVPDSVKPGCYYYWISDNISKEGVVKDIQAMAKVGIGRTFIGNVGFDESDMFLKYGKVKLFSEEWWNITEAAISEGTKRGVNIGLFNSPGWSQSGGPWIKHTDAMRYITGEEIQVEGPKQFSQKLTGSPLFQDVAVIAFPQPEYDDDVLYKHSPHASVNIDSFEVQKAVDGDTLTEALLPASVNNTSVVNIDISTANGFTARSLVLYPAKKPMQANIELQVNNNGSFKTIKAFYYDRSNSALNVGFIPRAPVAISFPVVTANQYRLVLTNIKGNGGFAEIELTPAAKTERYEEKQLAKMFQTPLPLWNEYQWQQQSPVDDSATVINATKVVNLTSSLSADGTLTWNVPAGKWIIIRYGMMPTGVTNAPATPEGRGYDIDKMNKTALVNHFNSFVGKIQQRIPAAERSSLKYIVADSYETGSQNWTDDYAESFKKQYGYDPLPWLPVLSGRVVDSKDKSDRFLWDMRRLIADKVAYDYVGGLREISNKHGIKLWLENYGHWGYPSEFLKYGGQSDEVAGEFWAEGDLGSIECRDASSAAHIYGKQSVSAESFTSAGNTYGRYPAMIKRRGDWSFTEGINNTIFHVYIQQPYAVKPGINAWFGTEFNRYNTWFNQGKAFIDYIRRCNFMLQQGKPVDDVAYFIGEDAPKMTGIRDPALPRGFQFDYINAEVIETRLSVKNGRLVLPDGMSFRMLVLPKLATMRPELLQKIEQLVKDGAVVMGPAPIQSPSLQSYPVADGQVQALAAKLWAGVDGKQTKYAQYGKGFIINGMSMEEAMHLVNLKPDFISNTTDSVLYTHRTTADGEVYFVSNQENKTISFTPTFRDAAGQPLFCDPVTAETRILPQFTKGEQGTLVPLTLAAGQSCFIVFTKSTATVTKKSSNNFPEPVVLQQLSRPWIVSFDTAMRGPAKPVTFDKLEDWAMRPEDSIKNYSGTAVYKTTFTVDKLPANKEVYINLGEVKVMATVKLNGKEIGTAWTAPYRVNATGAMKTGENKLEIEVVNTWINRLIGDSKLPEAERKTWSNVNPYKPDSKYDSSGLMGPVTITTVAY